MKAGEWEIGPDWLRLEIYAYGLFLDSLENSIRTSPNVKNLSSQEILTHMHELGDLAVLAAGETWV